MIVGVDIDDTSNELSESIALALAKEHMCEHTEFLQKLHDVHDIHRCVDGWTKDDIGPFFARNQWMFDEARPKDYIHDMLYGLRKRNFSFLILTHRTTKFDVPQRTYEWLERTELLPFFTEIHHANRDGRRLNKAAYAAENDLKLDAMIEDKLEIAMDFLQRKIPVVLFNYGHNQGYEHPLLYRVNNWWEAYQALCRIQIRSKEWQR